MPLYNASVAESMYVFYKILYEFISSENIALYAEELKLMNL